MKIRETKSGYRIILVLSGRSNVFLLTDGRKNVLIDTSPPGRWTKLEKSLRKNHINTIDYLVLTHAHFDHAGSAARIKNKYKARVIIHRAEAALLAKGEGTIPKGTNSFSRFIVKSLEPLVSSFLSYDPCQADVMIDSRYELSDSGFNAYILHTPGHSPGSVCIIVDDEVAPAGDTLFGVFKWSVFPPFADDTNKLMESWWKLLETGCSTFLPSHGFAKTRDELKREYEFRKKR
jgi:glyoxylase-like metal-dependent hydrolase (beta-lactamase superfamily II)